MPDNDFNQADEALASGKPITAREKALVAAERELCAKAAEPTTLEMYAPTHGARDRGYQQGRIDAAAAIRSRSK